MKIKCMDCKNETNNKCLIKKTTIKRTKYRKCSSYEFDSKREIARLEDKIKTRDREDAVRARNTEAHPLTGDLSRFRTSASK